VLITLGNDCVKVEVIIPQFREMSTYGRWTRWKVHESMLYCLMMSRDGYQEGSIL
jgi:hypothetical protein